MIKKERLKEITDIVGDGKGGMMAKRFGLELINSFIEIRTEAECLREERNKWKAMAKNYSNALHEQEKSCCIALVLAVAVGAAVVWILSQNVTNFNYFATF